MDLLLDPEEKIMCPYNSAHYIRRSRMNTHLVKCKKSYPESKLVECDFNVNHKVPEPELQYHHEHCPDRKKIEVTVYQEEGTVINKFPVHNVDVPTEEDWDDLDVPTYNPKAYCEKNEIIRYVAVESAAKRKDFRISERQRINQLASNRPSERAQDVGQANAAGARKNLPEKSKSGIKEETPDSISDLMVRLNIGKHEAFVPK